MGTKRVDRSDLEVRIGAAIRRARTAAGVTQDALAGALGVSPQQIQNYEKGTVRITASSLKYVADLLGTEIDKFFDDDHASSTADRPDHGDALR